jgi:hypothetical protein
MFIGGKDVKREGQMHKFNTKPRVSRISSEISLYVHFQYFLQTPEFGLPLSEQIIPGISLSPLCIDTLLDGCMKICRDEQLRDFFIGDN